MYEKGRIDYTTIDPSDRHRLEVQFETLFRQKIRRGLTPNELHRFRCVMIFLLPYYEHECWENSQAEISYREKEKDFWDAFDRENKEDENKKKALDDLDSIDITNNKETIN